jgi:hypothetical protein
MGYQTPSGIDANGGLNNTYFGYQAGQSATSTSYNTGIGYQTLKSVVQGGNSNTAVGYKALTANTTGANNTAIGIQALVTNTTGNSNTASGYNALALNTTGSSNTAYGVSALQSNTTGASNTAYGVNALIANTTGASNTANGTQALYANTTGSNNTAYGRNAILSNTTGGNNTALGYQAGYGSGTLADNRSVIDTYMTFLGFQASRDAAVASTTILTNGTAIGKNAQVGCNNCLVLGGTGADSVNVGIGTTTPYAKLSVVGQILAEYFNATSTTATSTFAGNLNVGGGALTYNNGTGVTEIANLTLGAQSFESDAGILSWTDMPVTSTSVLGTVNSYSAQIDGNPLLTVYGESLGDGDTWNRAVGIGTTTPFALLSIAGISTTTTATTRPLFDIASSTGASFLRVSAAGYLGMGTTTPAWLAQLVSSVSPQMALTDPNAGANLKHWTLRSVMGSLFFATSSDAYATSTISALTVNSNGYVGVATTSPWRTFSVNGAVAMFGLSASQGNAVCVTADGEITNPGASACTGSSERFKEKIETLASGFALDEISKLRVVSFDYKEGNYSPEDQKGSYGMLAEEVALIDDKLVDYGYDHQPLTLKFEKFIGLFVQAIQDLVARITGLEEKFNAQQEEINALKERMDALDGKVSDMGSGIGDTANGVADTVLPVITVEPASVTLSAGEPYNETGATATDDIDGDITAKIAITGDTVDTATPGTYTVKYNVSDDAGNPAEEKERTVIVNAASVPEAEPSADGET